MFNAERWELVFFNVDRDQEIIDLIIAKDAEFWMLVQTGEEPAPTKESPVLNLPPTEPAEVLTLDTPEWKIAVEQYREAKALREEAEALETQAKREIQSILEEHNAEVAEGAGLRVYWREQAGRRSVDGKKLKALHPDIYNQVLKQGKPYRAFRAYFLKGEDVE